MKKRNRNNDYLSDNYKKLILKKYYFVFEKQIFSFKIL